MNRRTFVQNTSLVASGSLIAKPLLADREPKDVIVEIMPDWQNEGRTLRHSWEGLGNIDQMRWMVRKDTLEHLELAHKELNMRHVRAVGIHHDDLFPIAIDPKDAMLSSDVVRKKRNNWQVVDYIFDNLIDIGINPMYTTAFTPSVMASGEQYVFQTKCNVTPPKNYNEWAEYITETLKHFKYRYGKQRMDNWYYEVWNEPNLTAFYGGDQAEFFKLWEVTYKAIKNVDPDWWVGGPSTARAEWIEDFLKFTKDKGCYPDYIIAHCYNNDSEWAALSPFDGLQADKTNKSPNFLPGVVKGVNKLLLEHSFTGEMHWNEWGRSWFPFDEERETANEAAYIVKSMAEVSDKADYFAYWCLSDIYNQAGYGAETFHGNYGMLNLQGLKKPSYFAHQLLCMLGDTRLPVKSNNTDRLINAVVSKSKEGFQVLMYSFQKGFKPGSESKQIQTKVALPANINETHIEVFEINETENNIINTWEKAGSPSYLKYDERAEWENRNTLKKSQKPIKITMENGLSFLNFTMSSPGVVLFQFSK